MDAAPLKYSELMRRLSRFNVTEHMGKKTSVRMLKRLNLNGQGPTYPVGVKREGADIDLPTIRAILRRFDIAPADFGVVSRSW